MKFGIKHKLLIPFLVIIGTMILLGLDIARSERQYDGLVRDISETGSEIRTAREILNEIREIHIPLLAYSRPGARMRARRLVEDIHTQTLKNLDKLQNQSGSLEDVRQLYDQYWKTIQEQTLLIDGKTEESQSVVEERGVMNPSAGLVQIESRLAGVVEAKVEHLVSLGDAAERDIQVSPILKLPESYYTAITELISGLSHTFAYDELWGDMLELQVNTFDGKVWNSAPGGTRAAEVSASLDAWVTDQLSREVPESALEPYRNEELGLFRALQKWIRNYPDRLSACEPVTASAYANCFLDLYEQAVAIQRQIMQHSLNEAHHVEHNITTARNSVESVSRNYTIIFVGILVLSAVMAFYLFRQVVAPIRRLRYAFEQIASGRLEHRIDIQRSDELGELEAGFNTMAEAIGRRDQELTSARFEVEDLASQIRRHSEALERDVEERTTELQLAYEELKKTDRLKSEFIANISHELRTPLNSIIGFSKVILKGIDGPVTEKQKEDLALINRSGRHLLDLITQILDFSKLEAGRLDLRLESVSLCKIVEEAVSSFRPLIKDRPVDASYDCAEDLQPIQADRVRLLQIVTNLLSNGLKFTDRGRVHLDLRNWNAADPIHPAEPVAFDDGVLLTVSDTGIGIPAESHNLIFQKFQQMDGSSTRAHGGTGLGLTIAKELVLMHGGHIWFISSVGEGTSFYVLLPLQGRGGFR